MRGVYPLLTEDPFLTEMRSVLFATLQLETNYHRGFWDVYQKFGKSLVIWYLGQPRWELYGMGECEEQTTSCLKAALAEAGKKQEFWGGRGPPIFSYDPFIYTNHCYYRSDWPERLNYVTGYEEIRDENGRVCEWYQYSAMLLLLQRK